MEKYKASQGSRECLWGGCVPKNFFFLQKHPSEAWNRGAGPRGFWGLVDHVKKDLKDYTVTARPEARLSLLKLYSCEESCVSDL